MPSLYKNDCLKVLKYIKYGILYFYIKDKIFIFLGYYKIVETRGLK